MEAFSRSDKEIYIPIHLAIVLKEDEERVLVGSEFDISSGISGASDELYFDKIRPLGSFLSDFQEDSEGEWFGVINELSDIIKARKSQLTKHQKREKNYFAFLSEREADVLEILKRKYATNNPVNMYYSLSIWNEYLRRLEREVQRKEDIDKLAEEFFDLCMMLVRPLYDREKGDITENEELTERSAIYAWFKNKSPSDNRIVLQYPKYADEYAMGIWTIHGLKNYYAEKMKCSKKYITRCANCGGIFLTKNTRQMLCCEECRKVNARKNQALQRKQEKYHKLETLSNRENRYWDIRIAKLKKSQAGDVIEEGQRLREQFRAEQKQRKRDYKAGKMTFSTLSSWYTKQRDVIDEYIESVKI